MAKINREFLVPYLQDVCALYMADLKVCAQIFGLQKEMIQRKRGEAIDPPEEPVYEKTFSFLGALGIVLMCSPLLMLYYFSIPERERGTAPIVSQCEKTVPVQPLRQKSKIFATSPYTGEALAGASNNNFC